MSAGDGGTLVRQALFRERRARTGPTGFIQPIRNSEEGDLSLKTITRDQIFG